jgi:hypothetical protein
VSVCLSDHQHATNHEWYTHPAHRCCSPSRQVRLYVAPAQLYGDFAKLGTLLHTSCMFGLSDTCPHHAQVAGSSQFIINLLVKVQFEYVLCLYCRSEPCLAPKTYQECATTSQQFFSSQQYQRMHSASADDDPQLAAREERRTLSCPYMKFPSG